MSSLFCSQESISIYLMLNGDKEPDPSIPLLKYYYAYMGNLDLYLKVYNKDNIDEKEMLCIAEGCHTDFEFAKWCYSNISSTYNTIHKAISECFIKNNDLSYVRDDIYCIWYPHSPSEETLRKLYQLKPLLKYLIARACVVGKYSSFYKELNVLPEIHIITEIIESGSTHFLTLSVNSRIHVCMDDIYNTLYEKPCTFLYYTEGTNILTNNERTRRKNYKYMFVKKCINQNDIHIIYEEDSRNPTIDLSQLNMKMYLIRNYLQ